MSGERRAAGPGAGGGDELDLVEWLCENCGRWWPAADDAPAQVCRECGAEEGRAGR